MNIKNELLPSKKLSEERKRGAKAFTRGVLNVWENTTMAWVKEFSAENLEAEVRRLLPDIPQRNISLTPFRYDDEDEEVGEIKEIFGTELIGKYSVLTIGDRQKTLFRAIIPQEIVLDDAHKEAKFKRIIVKEGSEDELVDNFREILDYFKNLRPLDIADKVKSELEQ